MRGIDDDLGVGLIVNGGDDAVLDTDLLVQHLDQRRQAGVVLGLGGGQRDRAHGAAVEAAQERDHGVPAGERAGQLERGLHDFGARSEERRVGKERRSRWSPYH